MFLIAGSYEKFVWGFSFFPKTLTTLTPLFSYPSHSAPIKTLAAAGAIAASGSSDDSIKIYDLSSSSEVGSLLDHRGPVTALSFYSSPSSPHLPLNLLSAGGDGTLNIYGADPFVLLKGVSVHRKGINDLAVHPSGRVALTVGRDERLGMVNLVRGRRSFVCKLAKEAEIVEYDGSTGDKFFMVSGERIGVHEAEDARVVWELEGRKRVLCVAVGESGLLFTGGEDRNITAWDCTSGKIAYCLEDAHSARVKGLSVFKSRSDGQTSETPNILASASSDGVIRTWDLRMTAKEKPNPLAEANTKSRLTCLAGSSKCEYFSASSLFSALKNLKELQVLGRALGARVMFDH